MFKIHPEIPESMSLEAKAFILRCFEPDPDRRATALDLLTDEFLTVTSRKKKSKSNFTGGFSSARNDVLMFSTVLLVWISINLLEIHAKFPKDPHKVIKICCNLKSFSVSKARKD